MVIKEVVVKAIISEDKTNFVVRSKGFTDGPSRHIELAGLFQLLARQELDKVGTTKSMVLER